MSAVVLNPALSDYDDAARASVWWLAKLLAFQALVALALWVFFVRLRPRQCSKRSTWSTFCGAVGERRASADVPESAGQR